MNKNLSRKKYRLPRERQPVKRIAPKQMRDSNGNWLCRNCPAPVAKGMQSYCSAKCRDDFAIKYFPACTRWTVFNRDNGVCSRCGCDTEKIRRIIRWIRSKNYTRLALGWMDLREACNELGFRGTCTRGDFWQADHIRPCVEGGWGTGLDNLRTLCTPCHREVTAELAARRAKQNRERQT